MPGGTVTDMELEYEPGRLVSKVGVADQHLDHGVTVDATDGTVLRDRLDDD